MCRRDDAQKGNDDGNHDERIRSTETEGEGSEEDEGDQDNKDREGETIEQTKRHEEGACSRTPAAAKRARQSPNSPKRGSSRLTRPCETKKPPACAGGSCSNNRVQLTG
jgi:hypothetical protein